MLKSQFPAGKVTCCYHKNGSVLSPSGCPNSPCPGPHVCDKAECVGPTETEADAAHAPGAKPDEQDPDLPEGLPADTKFVKLEEDPNDVEVVLASLQSHCARGAGFLVRKLHAHMHKQYPDDIPSDTYEFIEKLVMRGFQVKRVLGRFVCVGLPGPYKAPSAQSTP